MIWNLLSGNPKTGPFKMLPSKYRLSLKDEFNRIKKSGRYLNGELVTIFYTPSATLRFGFIVSNKISNKSSKRNRVKRLLREAVRNLIPEIKKPIDVIVFARTAIIDKDLRTIKKEIKGLLKKVPN